MRIFLEDIEKLENVKLEKIKNDKCVIKHKEKITGSVPFEITEGATTLTPLPDGIIKTKINNGKDDNNGFNSGADPQESEERLQIFEKKKNFERVGILGLEHCVDIKTTYKLRTSGRTSNNRLRAILSNMGLEGGVYYLDKNKRAQERKYTINDFNEIESDEKKIGTWAKKRGVRVKLYSKATEKGIVNYIDGDLIRFEIVYTDRKAHSKNRIDDIEETLQIIKDFVYEYNKLKGKTITSSTKVLDEIIEGLKRCLEKYI